MIKPLSLALGARYTRSKRRNRFVSFISLASLLGIMLGVAVLITVLSVMNGFDEQIRGRFFAIAPQVTVTTHEDIRKNWMSTIGKLKRVAGVNAAAPFVSGKGMLSYRGQVSGVGVLGVMPKAEKQVSKLAKLMVDGSLTSLTRDHFNMVLGSTLAANLGLSLGDKLVLLTPQANDTPLGIVPRFRRFTVSGIFDAGSGFGFDSQVAYINFYDALRLFSDEQATRGFHVKIDNLYHAQAITRQLQKQLPDSYWVSNWSQQFGAFFQALVLEKRMMFLILSLIIAVAVFNLVSSLVMVVNDKRGDIAILRAMGASSGFIMRVFMVQGMLIGLLGSVLGLVGGLLLAHNATAIVDGIEQLLHVKLISASVYYVDYLPSKILWVDLVRVVGLSWLFCLLATIYPAWQAARTNPTEVLRYD